MVAAPLTQKDPRYQTVIYREYGYMVIETSKNHPKELL